MDKQAFAAAQDSYNAGDFGAALIAFMAIDSETADFAPGEAGELNHLMGNCYVKQRRYADAAKVYRKALLDEGYAKRGAVNANLGTALTASKEYEAAVACYEAALSDPTYSTPYKAFSGMGAALLRLGRTSEAGIAYRRAALDEGNPDPSKALTNLGVCFMGLGRPQDAVEAYSTALEFETSPASRNKTCANLGQAYAACGRLQDAVIAFERAMDDGTYHLSEAAAADYARCKAAGIIAEQTGESVDPARTVVAPSMVEGDIALDDGGTVIPSPEDTGFFTITEEQLQQMDREEKGKVRKVRHTGLRALIVILIILILLVAAAAFGYFRGFGYPSQDAVTADVFAAAGTDDAATYWADGISAESIARAMSAVEPGSDVAIDAIDRSMNESTVYATATLPEGGTVHYKVDMVRSGISWKVANLDLDFASRQQ